MVASAVMVVVAVVEGGRDLSGEQDITDLAVAERSGCTVLSLPCHANCAEEKEMQVGSVR